MSIEKIREVFQRMSEIQEELKNLDYNLYKKFRDQNGEISDLEHYNLRRIIRDDAYEAIDTLELRKALIKKWEVEIKQFKPTGC